MWAREDLASIPYYKRAVELEPNFALAYGRLGTVFANLGQLELGEQYLKQAMGRRERASERERLYIEAHCYGTSGHTMPRRISGMHKILLGSVAESRRPLPKLVVLTSLIA
jgi:hypothetical protein